MTVAATNQCPAWCVVNHDDLVHPDDNWHDSESAGAWMLFRDAATSEPVSADLGIVATRRIGEDFTWVTLTREGRLDETITVSLESAAVLSKQLQVALRMWADDF